MATSASAFPLHAPPAHRFWSRESRNLKLGIKTGLAGAITYAAYAGWHLPEGYWAVFTALVVTQANVERRGRPRSIAQSDPPPGRWRRPC